MKYFVFSFTILLMAIISLAAGTAIATTYVIKFGGSLGKKYAPASLNVNVGDTIVWTGNFDEHSLSLMKSPAGAKSFKSVQAGHTFRYIVTVAGRYDYQCDDHVDQGMIGSFTATAGAPPAAGQK